MKGLTTELVEKLAMFNVSKNHSGKWGYIVGKHSCTYSFMHKDKQKVLEHLRDNYKTYFKSEKQFFLLYGVVTRFNVITTTYKPTFT